MALVGLTLGDRVFDVKQPSPLYRNPYMFSPGIVLATLALLVLLGVVGVVILFATLPPQLAFIVVLMVAAILVFANWDFLDD